MCRRPANANRAKFVRAGCHLQTTGYKWAVFELFHQIANSGSAQVRRYLTEHGLAGEVKFKNIDFGQHLETLKGRGGDGRVPALWDGAVLHVGAEAIIARLKAHGDVGRA